MASVQALLKAIKVVPTQGVPETVDAFLMATSTLPNELFSSLEAVISQMLEDNEVLEAEDEYLKSIFFAILHLFKIEGLDDQMLSKMIWGLGIPFLQKSKLSLTSFQTVVAQFLVETIARKKSWDYARVSLVPYLLKSMEVILGNQQYIGNGSNVNTIQSKVSSLSLMDDDRSYKYGLLKFHVVCHLVALLILEASNNIKESKSGSSIVKDFLTDVVSKFFHPMLSLMSRTTEDLQRQCVIRVFLPPVLKGIQNVDWNIYKELVTSLQKDLWEHIKFLFSQVSSQRQDAYIALDLSAEFFLYPFNKEPKDTDIALSCSNICLDMEFWENIKSGLVDDEPLTRKRALHILKAVLKETLPPMSSMNQDHKSLKSQKKSSMGKSTTRRDRYADIEARSLGLWDCEVERWKAFFLLYDMLDEYGTHLVEAAWSNQITVLIPTLCGKDSDVGPSTEKQQHAESQQPKLKFHLHDLATSIWWVTALWERGFKHDNPQVRRFILQSFLELKWEKVSSLGNAMPNEFLLGPLFSVLNDPIHHKDFGVKGIYSSTVANAASSFFNLHSKSLAKRDNESFILKMVGRMSSGGFCRPGFMTLIMCLDASALPYLPSRSKDCNGDNTGSGTLNGESIEILDCLGFLVENSKKHFNPSYRLKACLHLLRAAKNLVEVPEATFDKFFWFLSVFPQDFITNEGPLHQHVRQWIQSTPSFSKMRFQQWLRDGLYEKADMFVRPPTSGTVVIVSDEEVKSWQQYAEKWARVVSLGFLNENSVSELMMFVHRHACNIYQRAYSSTCLPEKLLLLLDSMLKIFSSLSKKSNETRFSASIPKGMEDDFRVKDVSDELYFCTDNVARHLQQIVSSNMDEFIAHAERASSVFWNYDYRDRGPLPSSVTGKLGGPSQRRLPEKVASDVIKGVIAIEVLADCISCLCKHGGKVPDSAMLFIWDFANKAAKGKKATEEIEGEIQLGLFEALAHVLRALSLSVNPDIMSLVGNMIFFEVGKDKILDTTVFSLLENMNGLLQSRTLARSRQVVLLQEKWCCLEALLSIPKCKVKATLKDDNSATSQSILKIVLLDAVSSLESAGEDKLLPLLRCVRWLMHWNTLHHICTVDSAGPKTGMEVAWSLVRAAWAAVADSNKRRVSSVSAFLSSIFHSNVFSDITMHYYDGDVGPLKWLLCRLLEQGSKSPRTMRLMSMHIAGLWLKFPKILEYYMEEVKLLSLHGGESVDEELDGQISDNVMAAKEYGTLMQSLDPELIEEFRNSELYVRVTIAVLIHKLAELVELANISCQSEEKQDAFRAASFGRNLIINLLNSLATDTELSKELYKKKSAIHRRKIRAWQMTCILSRFVDDSIIEEVMGLLQKCLLKNNLPSVRQYAEIFGILLCLRFPLLVKAKVVPALADYNMKAQTLASYVFISINVVMHATPVSVQQMLVDDVVPAVIPYFTTHHHPLRSFSQILMYEVLHNILKIHPSCLEVDKTLPLEKRCLQSLVSFLDENAECKRIRLVVNKFLASFDPVSASTPRGIFTLRCGGEEDPSKPLEDIPFECAPVAVMDKVSEFLNEVREDLRQSMAMDAITLKSEEISDSTTIIQDSPQSLDSYQTNPTDFQRKIASLRFTETSPVNNVCYSDHNGTILSDMELEEDLLQTTVHSRVEDLVKMRGNRQDLIVVATLLGRIPNLAGLARTCEVFKASTLVLADAAVTQDRQFQLISVTAEMWVPIKEVPEANLHEFLLLKSQEGYGLVGLEQTANSVSLEKYTFPRKSVLVLGREKEGIPIDIIQLLDACVEIPQLGVVRSLNVHVSGAIAVWEYTRQYLQKS